MVKNDDGFYVEYRAKCTHGGCKGTLKLTQAISAGWRLGDMVPEDSTNHTYGRCPHCKRYKMQIVQVPGIKPPAKTRGFTKIPTE